MSTGKGTYKTSAGVTYGTGVYQSVGVYTSPGSRKHYPSGMAAQPEMTVSEALKSVWVNGLLDSLPKKYTTRFTDNNVICIHHKGVEQYDNVIFGMLLQPYGMQTKNGFCGLVAKLEFTKQGVTVFLPDQSSYLTAACSKGPTFLASDPECVESIILLLQREAARRHEFQLKHIRRCAAVSSSIEDMGSEFV